MKNLKPEILIITILIIYMISCFVRSIYNPVIWNVGISIVGLSILFFNIIVENSTKMAIEYFAKCKSVYYIFILLFYPLFMLFFIIQGIRNGVINYGKKE